MLATLEAKLITGTIGFVLIFAGLFAVYEYGKSVQGNVDALKAANIKLATDKLILDSQTANETLTSKLETIHEQNVGLLNTLAASHPAGGLRLPTCSGSGNKQSATGSKPATAGAGSLPVDAQDAFNRFTAGLDKLALEADKLTEQCRVVSNWAKAQKLPIH